MADPFELWRRMWSTAILRGLEQFAEVVPRTACVTQRRNADAFDLAAFPIATSFRRCGFWNSTPARTKLPPVLIVAP
jgi:hypothetical protein